MSVERSKDLSLVAAEVAKVQQTLEQIRAERGGRLTLLERAEQIYRARRRRETLFDPALFGEPAFDILLDLYIAFRRRHEVSVSSACIAAAVPATTALRHIALLERRGLIVRRNDPFDGRRSFLELSQGAVERLERFLEDPD